MSAAPEGSTEQGKLPGKLKGKIGNIKTSLFFISKSEDKNADHVCFCTCHINISISMGPTVSFKARLMKVGEDCIFLNKIIGRR